jgi:hypothetical protein
MYIIFFRISNFIILVANYIKAIKSAANGKREEYVITEAALGEEVGEVDEGVEVAEGDEEEAEVEAEVEVEVEVEVD